ncbi:MAG: penicillin-binding protein 2 [bacterium]|nr:penicillin-binding protein 2 [bacterium]
MKFRFFFLIGTTTLAFLFIIFNLYHLQIGDGERYAQRSQAYNNSDEFLLPRRGNIYFVDKGGDVIPAAITKEFQNVFAVPKVITDPDLAAGEIIAILPELSLPDLVLRLSKSTSEYDLLARHITEAQIAAFKAAEIKGIYFESDRARYYPLEESGAQVIGFVGLSDESEVAHGKYGIELYYDSELTGKIGSRVDGKLKPPVPGRDVVLTLDREIQARAEDILSRLVQEYQGTGGSIIVQDPRSGKLLALANYPAFNPNSYADASFENFKNPVIEGLYEPGSVFKLVTMAAALDSGAITPETTYTDTGSMTLNGRTVKNWDLKAHGTLTMTGVIEGSVNTGSIFAERKTGHSTFYNYLLKFGLKEPTNITLPGEVVGRLTPLEEYPRDINFATASYGQGISITPLRLLSIISAIANKGVMRRPFILEEERTSEELEVISPAAARQVTTMMVSAVRKNVIADIPRYDIAGKTGTAFIPEHGGYSDEVINTYVGYAPAFDPRFTVLVKLERPKGAPLAGATVVPAFRELTEFLLNYYHIPPTNLDLSAR